MSFKDNLRSILEKYNGLSEKLLDAGSLSSADYSKLSKEYSDLQETATKIQEFFKLEQELQDAQEMLEGADKEMQEIAKEESLQIKQSLEELEEEIKISLLPKDDADSKNIILEIRAGTGGEEAALFAADLFRMYSQYASSKKWQIEVLNANETGIGGYKEIICAVKGKNVFSRFKFESGVHRVQRVPDTETGGRIHTSAVTVAILPEAEEIDFKIEDKDLRIDTYRASGAGGQHVNTTDSAVRITHIPTGVVVTQQDEKSQHKNKAKALKILRSRLYDLQRQEDEQKRSQERKSQVGSGDRSERIRTYNYPQGRVSDHRINLTLYKLDVFLEGELDEMIDAIVTFDNAQKLLNMNG